MTLKVVFFCGHQSLYGRAHLLPILEEFDVQVVVVASDSRWKIFRHALSGKSYYSPREEFSALNTVKFIVKKFLPRAIVATLQGFRGSDAYIKSVLKERGIPLWSVHNVNDDKVIEKLRGLNPDLFLAAAYPQIFFRQFLSVPKKGAVNFHPALLPKYRGAHPHFWQIVNGEEMGGVTAHFLTENIDEGDIIAQVSFPIDKHETYDDLYKKIVEHTPLLVAKVRQFFEKDMQAWPQDPNSATFFRNDRDIHRRIFWNIHNTKAIYNLVRTGRAFCFFRHRKVVFLSAYMSESNRNLTNNVRVENGTIVDVSKDSISIKTIDGCINVEEIQEGRKRFSSLEWAKKKNLYIGEKFE